MFIVTDNYPQRKIEAEGSLTLTNNYSPPGISCFFLMFTINMASSLWLQVQSMLGFHLMQRPKAKYFLVRLVQLAGWDFIQPTNSPAREPKYTLERELFPRHICNSRGEKPKSKYQQRPDGSFCR
jgi:hypothetical protein